MPNMTLKPCIIIPVYNHGNAIHSTLARLKAYELPFILVNDGSNLECSNILKSIAEQQPNNITLFEHSHNQGKGAAVKTGLLQAHKLGYTHGLQIDADGQHNSDDIPTFLQQATDHPKALVTGHPIYDNSIPKHRLYARYITHVWVWINTLSFTIKDSMCGFRVYPIESSCNIINHYHLADRMAFDTEILVRLYWSGVPIISLPTAVHYPEDGVSHFQGLLDNLIISKMHTRLFFGMLIRLPKLLLMKYKNRA